MLSSHLVPTYEPMSAPKVYVVPVHLMVKLTQKMVMVVGTSNAYDFDDSFDDEVPGVGARKDMQDDFDRDYDHGLVQNESDTGVVNASDTMRV